MLDLNAIPLAFRVEQGGRLQWQRQGKRDEARQLLATIYGWFTNVELPLLL